jgi:homoserine dehydrogenase
LGTVGTGTAKILLDPAERHPLVRDINIYRVGVRSLDKPRNLDFPPERLTTDLESIVTDPDIDVVVELIGGLEPARSLILKSHSPGQTYCDRQQGCDCPLWRRNFYRGE